MRNERKGIREQESRTTKEGVLGCESSCLTAEGKPPAERKTGRLKKGRKEQMKQNFNYRLVWN